MNKRVVGVFSRLYQFPGWFGKKRKNFNQYMKNHYSPISGALAGTAFSLVLAVMILFLPPYLGVASDGTTGTVMEKAGLCYLSDETESNYSNYFVRVYGRTMAESGGISSHIALVRIARALDHFFTGDQYFDIRFLAFCYLVLYLPAVYLVLKAALDRLHFFSETLIVTIAGVLIFADSSYLVYFNSLYPEPLIFISMLYLVGAGMSLQREKKWQPFYFVLLLFWGIILCGVQKHCFVVGLALAILCFLLFRLYRETRYRLLLGMMAGAFSVAMLFSIYGLDDEFTDTSKYHAMTRGVLLQSKNPEETLEEFHINGSYAMLTDTSLYDSYPATTEDNPLIQEGFLDQYRIMDIGIYYLRHPSTLLGMLDIGIKSSFDLRRNYCGNYEESYGMPKRAQTAFWSAYGIYKMRSAPKTIGYLVLLIVAFVAMSGRKMFQRKGVPERFHYVYLCVMAVVAFIGVGDILYVMIRSGDAQLTQYQFLLGLSMDFLFYFVLTEILYKLNILETKNEEAKN